MSLVFALLVVTLLSGCPWMVNPFNSEEGEGAVVAQEGEGAAEGEVNLPLEGEGEQPGPEGVVEGTPEGEGVVPPEGEAESPGLEGIAEGTAEGEVVLPPEGEGEQLGLEGAVEGVVEGETVLPPEGEAELPGSEGAAEGTAEGEVVPPLEGEGEWPEPEGEVDGSLEEEGEAVAEGETPPTDALPLCEYWPLVTGNYWEGYLQTIIASRWRLQVDDMFTHNGCEVFAVSWVTVNGRTTRIQQEYWVFLEGWLYVTEDPADLDVLPAVGEGMQRFLPEWLIPGVSFVSEYLTNGEGVWTPSVDEADIAQALEQASIAPEARSVDEIVVLGYSVESEGEPFAAFFPWGRYYGPMTLSGMNSITQSHVLYSTECSGLREVE